MTRQECDKKLLDLVERAYAIVREFDPEASHVDLFASGNGCCAMSYKGPPGERERLTNAYRSPDGDDHYSREV